MNKKIKDILKLTAITILIGAIIVGITLLPQTTDEDVTEQTYAEVIQATADCKVLTIQQGAEFRSLVDIRCVGGS